MVKWYWKDLFMNYIPINIKTEYDLMNSLIKIDDLISYAASLIPPPRPCVCSSFFVQCSEAPSAPGPCALFLPFSCFLHAGFCYRPQASSYTSLPLRNLSWLIYSLNHLTQPNGHNQTGSGNCKIQAWSETQKVSWGPDYHLVSWPPFLWWWLQRDVPSSWC